MPIRAGHQRLTGTVRPTKQSPVWKPQHQSAFPPAGGADDVPPLANLKICGIMDRDTAQLCADLGVGALGAVFFPGSPRNVTPRQARMMFEGLPQAVARVGVFVDQPVEEVIAAAHEAALDTVQLHGNEPVKVCLSLRQVGFRVIKVLKTGGAELVAAARALPADVGVLVECGHGALPGGNGAAWDWRAAAPLAEERPFALAGGLTPDNILEATRQSGAVAWDVSSGVEQAPGIKDPAAVRQLVARFLTGAFPGLQPFQDPAFWAPVNRPVHP